MLLFVIPNISKIKICTDLKSKNSRNLNIKLFLKNSRIEFTEPSLLKLTNKCFKLLTIKLIKGI